MNKYESEKTNSNNKAKVQKTYIDYEIFQGKIRLVEDGKIEIVERDDAIDKAHSMNMNLVQVAYNKNDFPHSICKIINYSKFKYEQKKKDKASKRASKLAAGEEKEVVFSIRIDDNDKKIKINHIKEFLKEKNTRVKITIKLLRRENNLFGMAKNMMKDILNEFNGIATLDSMPVSSRNILSCVIKSMIS